MWILPEQTTGFLSEEQKVQITKVFNALQPGDASRRVPNAEQAGAVKFIDLLLARDAVVFEEIPKWRLLYGKALAALDAQALKLYFKSLADLTLDEVADILTKLENASLLDFLYEGEKLDQQPLFDVLRRHCIQGCFADKRWGGNTNDIMWKWFGYQEETKESTKIKAV